ncbi:MAG: hypothetical protein HYU77_01605 [Betaproteobacteria bacterium]|nr:hypothetical protein [Betaproteobacteria bacterium]
MYIIAIGWLYVVILVAATEKSLAAAVMTLVWYGALPLALFLWVFGPRRKRKPRLPGMPDEIPHQPDGADAKRDQ